LSDFIGRAARLFPADHYGLIMWDHGDQAHASTCRWPLSKVVGLEQFAICIYVYEIEAYALIIISPSHVHTYRSTCVYLSFFIFVSILFYPSPGRHTCGCVCGCVRARDSLCVCVYVSLRTCMRGYYRVTYTYFAALDRYELDRLWCG
jgi:hypothetical protein